VPAPPDVRRSAEVVPHAPAVTVPLEYLPFPAAFIDAESKIAASNLLWRSAHPTLTPGQSSARWSGEVHADSPQLRDELLTGIEQVLRGERALLVQTSSYNERPHRIAVSRCPPGALILHQDLDPAVAVNGHMDFQAHKMETVGRLVGGVAHDFANLLTLIAGYADILLNRIGQQDPLRPEVDEIRKAANRGARLTGQLLGFTRGRTAEPKPVDLNTLIAEMQRMLRQIIGEYVDLQTSLAPGLAKVMVDPGQMEQVIMNLVLNARDAMPGGGQIRIESANSDLSETAAQAHGLPPGPYVLLSINDTGHGMDSETVDRVFQPFFTTKDEGKGTGLGLSTVMGIVKQSGGDIWVRSAPGKGASFTVCLPQIQQPQGEADIATAPPEAAGCETVLLVEDEESVRRLLSHVLQRRGYQVLEACNGAEALGIFQKRGREIHLVITDMVMPRMTGRELGEHLLRIRPDMKIIYMSGYTDDVLVRTGAIGPGMTFLQKPLRPEALAAKVREALDRPSRAPMPR
jgi:two-component system cell cycle sensor histidine kinase/response regulator CckA